MTEAHGLSVLDVVKHAVKTVITALEPCDRVSVVPFDSSSSVLFPLGSADEKNKLWMLKRVSSNRHTSFERICIYTHTYYE